MIIATANHGINPAATIFMATIFMATIFVADLVVLFSGQVLFRAKAGWNGNHRAESSFMKLLALQSGEA